MQFIGHLICRYQIFINQLIMSEKVVLKLICSSLTSLYGSPEFAEALLTLNIFLYDHSAVRSKDRTVAMMNVGALQTLILSRLSVPTTLHWRGKKSTGDGESGNRPAFPDYGDRLICYGTVGQAWPSLQVLIRSSQPIKDKSERSQPIEDKTVSISLTDMAESTLMFSLQILIVTNTLVPLVLPNRLISGPIYLLPFPKIQLGTKKCFKIVWTFVPVKGSRVWCRNITESVLWNRPALIRIVKR